jgi:hypothetical protein
METKTTRNAIATSRTATGMPAVVAAGKPAAKAAAAAPAAIVHLAHPHGCPQADSPAH